MTVRLTREQARRVAICGQVLTAHRPGDIVETVDALGVVNIEPTAAIAPSADLILWSRLGWPYQPADLARLVEHDRAIFEWGGFYRPMTDLALLIPEMRTRPASAAAREWLAANDAFRRDILARLQAEGALRPAQIPDTAAVPWRSSGWTNNRNTLQMLEILVMTGEVAISARDAKGRVFDLARRVYPGDVPELSPEAASRERAERRLAALGIARASAVSQPVEPIDVGEIGEVVEVEGTAGPWRVDAGALAAADGFVGRTALLSPFDRLVFDRERLRDLFAYEYILEMYKPAARRRWGYFALPILHGDAFVGKLDAKADRRAGILQVNAVHEDVPFTEDVASAVEREIAELGRWLGLEVRGLAGSR